MDKIIERMKKGQRMKRFLSGIGVLVVSILACKLNMDESGGGKSPYR